MTIAALSAKHPLYCARERDWYLMSDAYEGERAVKERGEIYLPPTAAHVAEGLSFGQAGWTQYQAYLTRAVYHELVRPALMAMLGVMHRKGPVIELPPKLEPLRAHCMFGGEDINWLLQKATEQAMLMGRYGIMTDVKNGAGPADLPYFVGYDANSIINWDSTQAADQSGPRKLGLVVLDETGFKRTSGLTWAQVMRYRVLALGDTANSIWEPNNALPAGTYVAASATGSVIEDFVQPQIGGRNLDEVPFVFIGPRDLVPEPDAPVLMPLARMALAIYRTEADYRQSLYMQGQDTLVVIGQQADINQNRTRVGAFGSIDLPLNGDAKYIGADSGGISEQATAIQNDLQRAAQLGAQLLSERGNEAEAGNALAIRVASRTATLTTVAKTSAKGVENALKLAAKWVGADPDKVMVKPNMDFADDPAQAQDLVYLQTAKNMGLPISERSVHGWLKRREFTEMDYEEEKALVDKETPSIVPPSGGVRGVQSPQGGPGGGQPTRASTTSRQAVQKQGGDMSTK
jgi:hypothetical protein